MPEARPWPDWLEVVNPDVSLGHIHHVLFDFDGTLSVIREGWEKIMRPLMVEMICNGANPSPEERTAIEAEVWEYVDRSTGILTIRQMEWLANAARRHGLAREPKDARTYKQIYNERLLRPVRERLGRLTRGEVTQDDLMIRGARAFLKQLHARGVTMYLCSGTDHAYVLEEAGALGIVELFTGGVYGALDDTEANDKARIIERILDGHKLRGVELLVVGDGPVEIRHAKARNAVALGIASDEVRRSGLNRRKRERLLAAGADLIVADFAHARELASFLMGGG